MNLVQLGQERVLTRELHSIIDQARTRRFTIEHDPDKISPLIAIWAQNFLVGLHHGTADVVIPTYIEFMQDILTDPYTGEPLDSPVLFGLNDGYTYGKMSYEISFYLRAPNIRNRSPMFPDDPRPFVHEPHPLVERLLTWLQVRGARYFSQDLIERHARIVPQTINTSRETEAAMDLLFARQRFMGVRLFDEQLQESLSQVTLEVELEGLENQSGQTTRALQSSHAELGRIQEREAGQANGLQTRMEAHMRAQATALSAPSTPMANLNHFGARAQEALNQLRQTRDRLHAEMAQLERENEEIKHTQQELAKECDQLNQDVVSLQQSIVETKIAIKKAKMVNVVEIIAWTAGSVIGSMALNALIGSSSMHVTTTFSRREALLSILKTG